MICNVHHLSRLNGLRKNKSLAVGQQRELKNPWLCPWVGWLRKNPPYMLHLCLAWSPSFSVITNLSVSFVIGEAWRKKATEILSLLNSFGRFFLGSSLLGSDLSMRPRAYQIKTSGCQILLSLFTKIIQNRWLPDWGENANRWKRRLKC